jgi:hypothetical protein
MVVFPVLLFGYGFEVALDQQVFFGVERKTCMAYAELAEAVKKHQNDVTVGTAQVFCPKKEKQVILLEESWAYRVGSGTVKSAPVAMSFLGYSVQSWFPKAAPVHGFSKVNLGMSLCEPVCHCNLL